MAMDYAVAIVTNKKSGNKYRILSFQSYIVDQSLTKPADFFSFTISNNDMVVSDKITSGDEIDFYIGKELALNGIIDDVEVEYAIGSNSVNIIGRDKSSLLIDNEATPITLYNLTLHQYLQKRVAPYGINAFEIKNDAPFDKIVVNPGDNEWSIIEGLCKDRGIYPRYDRNVLVCSPFNTSSTPDYHFSNDTKDPSQIRFKAIRPKISGDVKSEVIVYGGHYSRGNYVNNSNIKGVAKDSSITVTKRRIINNDDIENNKSAQDMAKKELKEINRNAFTIELELHTDRAFYINKIARVSVKRLNLDCVMLVDNVQYRMSTEGGITLLTLKLIEGVPVKWGDHNIPTI